MDRKVYKICKKFLWWELIGNLLFGDLVVLNRMEQLFSDNEQISKFFPLISLVNLILFIIFTVGKSKIEADFYTNQEIEAVEKEFPEIAVEDDIENINIKEYGAKVSKVFKSIDAFTAEKMFSELKRLRDYFSDAYNMYDFILRMAAMFFATIGMLTIDIEIKWATLFTVVLELGFAINMILEKRSLKKVLN